MTEKKNVTEKKEGCADLQHNNIRGTSPPHSKIHVPPRSVQRQANGPKGVPLCALRSKMKTEGFYCASTAVLHFEIQKSCCQSQSDVESCRGLNPRLFFIEVVRSGSSAKPSPEFTGRALAAGDWPINSD